MKEGIPIEHIERVDLQEKIIWEIKKHIYDNRLKPGDMLPSQASMSAMTGASRTSVREAVKTMEAQGLLRTINGKGIYVECVDSSFHVGTPDTGYIVKLLIDSFGVRKALEGMAVELCTMNAGDEQLKNLSGMLSRVEEKYYKREYQSDLDLTFHQTLVALADNSLLSHMLKNIMQNSSGIWHMKDKIADILSDSIPGHRAMMDKMLLRDAEGAVDAYNEYMNRILSRLRSIVH